MARMVSMDEIAAKKFNLNIALYVQAGREERRYDVPAALQTWQDSRDELRISTQNLFNLLETTHAQ